MDLKSVFAETYGICNQEIASADPTFVADIQKIISRLNATFAGGFDFSLSNSLGGPNSVMLMCCDASMPDERASVVRLSEAYDRDGQGVQVGSDNAEIYDVSDDQGMDYLCESVVKKVARDFAECDRRVESLAAMKKGFGL